MIAYNENSGVEFLVSFKDTAGNASLPTTVHYRLDCRTTLATLIDWTSAVPDVAINSSGVSEVTASLAVPGIANAIQNDRNNREIKTLLVVADKDLPSEYSQEYSYVVRNIQGR